jgi:hypothetical protein
VLAAGVGADGAATVVELRRSIGTRGRAPAIERTATRRDSIARDDIWHQAFGLRVQSFFMFAGEWGGRGGRRAAFGGFCVFLGVDLDIKFGQGLARPNLIRPNLAYLI